MQRNTNTFFSTNSVSRANPRANLTKQEEDALGDLEKLIDSTKNDDIDYLIYALPKYPVDVLQKLYDASPKLQDFCQKNVKFHEAVANILQSHDYINIEITSMDRKEHLTVFDLFRAMDNMSEYYRNVRNGNARKSNEVRLHCIRSLNIACELGLYNALLARCDINTTMLSNTTVSDAKKEEAVESIVADTKRLSNLYWLMGYVAAGWILHDVSNCDYFSKIQNGKDRTISFREESIKSFLCASFLEKNPDSERIEKNMTGGKEYIEDMEIKDGDKILRTWSDAKMALDTWSGNRETYERLRNTAKIEIDSILKPSAAEAKTTPKIG